MKINLTTNVTLNNEHLLKFACSVFRINDDDDDDDDEVRMRLKLAVD